MNRVNSTQLLWITDRTGRYRCRLATAMAQLGLTVLLMTTNIFSAFACDSAATNCPFIDVPNDHWAFEAVTFLRGKGIIDGYPAQLRHPQSRSVCINTAGYDRSTPEKCWRLYLQALQINDELLMASVLDFNVYGYSGSGLLQLSSLGDDSSRKLRNRQVGYGLSRRNVRGGERPGMIGDQTSIWLQGEIEIEVRLAKLPQGWAIIYYQTTY